MQDAAQTKHYRKVDVLQKKIRKNMEKKQ